MKKLNLKVWIAGFSVLLIALVATAMLSFTSAEKTTNPDASTSTDAQRADGDDPSVKTLTMIDKIINNSHDGTDKNYRIVEISSGNTSKFAEFCTNHQETVDGNNVTVNDFITYVFNGNKTIDRDFAEDATIEYTFIQSANILSSDLDVIKKADLIYLSNPDNKFKKNNDIPSELVTILSNFAIGDYKPFIIDYPSTNSGGGDERVYTYSSLYLNVLKSTKRYSLKWPTNGSAVSASASDYMQNNTTYLYLPIHGNDQQHNWTDAVEGLDNKKIAKMAVISNSGNSTGSYISNAVISELQPVTGDDLRKLVTDEDDYPAGVEPLSDVYVVSAGSALREYGYRYDEIIPAYVDFDYIKADEEVDYATLSKYDMIFVEDNTAAVVCPTVTYGALASCEGARKHIIYGSYLADNAKKTAEDVIILGKDDAQNYKTILDKTVSNKTALFNNVLATSHGDFASLVGMEEKSGGLYTDNIVYIINNGNFRGMGGSGDVSNTYTLLEIEPCYPIDNILAKTYYNDEIKNNYTSSARYGFVQDKEDFRYAKLGYYYLNTMGILDGVTADEITFDGETSLSALEAQGANAAADILAQVKANKTAIDYYAWRWSRAKFARLINMPYDQCKVIHMSMQEFNASPATLLDNYDMIYIGGDYSAYTPMWYWFNVTFGASKSERLKGYFTAMQQCKNIGEFMEKYPDYEMYFCYADYYPAKRANNGSFSDMTISERYDEKSTDGVSSADFGTQLGNDIDDTKLKLLNDYVEKGMPVIIGADVSKAFDTYNAAAGFDFKKVFPDYNPNDQNYFNNKLGNASYDDIERYFNELGLTGRIDPKSNIYSFLKSASQISGAVDSNIVWGFDTNKTFRVVNDGTLGNTYGGFATVFYTDNDEKDYQGGDIIKPESKYTGTNPDSFYNSKEVVTCNASKVLEVYKSAKVRPKFELTKCPPAYSTGVGVTSGSLDFTVTINNPADKPVIVKLYIDDNGDSKFADPDEIAMTQTMTGTGTLSYTYDKNFYGAIYWKVKVENGDLSSSVTGVCEVKRTTQERRDINLLQVMSDQADDSNYQGNDTIYLDTEDLLALNILDSNRFYDCNATQVADPSQGSALEYIYKTYLNDRQTVNAGNVGLNAIPDIVTDKCTADDLKEGKENYDFSFAAMQNGFTNNPLGIHEAKFGFPGIADPNSKGQYNDDIAVNLADNVNKDININLITMTVTDFNNYSKKIVETAAKHSDENNQDTYASKETWEKFASTYHDYFRYIENYTDGETLQKGNDIYTEMKADYPEIDKLDIKNATKNMNACVDVIKNSHKNMIYGYTGSNDAAINYTLEGVKNNESYYDIYTYIAKNNSGFLKNTKIYDNKTYSEHYENWRNVILYQQYFYYKYIYYSSLANVVASGNSTETVDQGTDEGNVTDGTATTNKKFVDYAKTGTKILDLTDVYDMIILGAALDYCEPEDEDFTSHGLNTIVNFVSNEGRTLAFQDTFSDKNSTSLFNIYLKKYFGILNDVPDRLAPKVSSQGKISSLFPFLTWGQIPGTYNWGQVEKNVTKVALTFRAKGSDTEGGSNGTSIYKFGRLATQWGNLTQQVDIQFDANDIVYGTYGFVMSNYASSSSTTTGLMKSYPNAIGDYIRVTGSNIQTYAIDTDNPKVTIYYSLAGGSNNTDSSYFAADKNHGANYYYLYTCDNCTFFSGGREKIHGYNKLNIEERQLIINAIINATKSKAIASNTTLELKTHDPDSDYQIIDVSPSSDLYTHYQYETEWSEDMEDPFEFIYNVKYDKDKGVKCTNLRIYFDLDYEENPVDNSGQPVAPKHVFKAGTDQMVYDGDSTYSYQNDAGATITDKLLNDHNKLDVQVDVDIYNQMFRDANTSLKLRNDYFTAKYKNDYTYLVVTVTDSYKDETGKTVTNDITKVIKIKKKPYLFDLT